VGTEEVKKEWEFAMNLNELKFFCSKRGNPHFIGVQKKQNTCFVLQENKIHAFVKLKCCKIKIERICQCKKKYCNSMIGKQKKTKCMLLRR